MSEKRLLRPINDPDVMEELIECLKIPMPRKHACMKVGVSYHTFRYWWDNGEKDLHAELDSKRAEWYLRMSMAWADGLAGILDKIINDKEGFKKDKAWMWLMEKLENKVYGWKAGSEDDPDDGINPLEKMTHLQIKQKLGQFVLQNNSYFINIVKENDELQRELVRHLRDSGLLDGSQPKRQKLEDKTAHATKVAG